VPIFSVAVDLSGQLVYVGNGLSSNVSVYSIDINGALTAVAGLACPTAILPALMAFSP
jgi:6-phosphogluconolactonase (cycloisomerase 2 family)